MTIKKPLCNYGGDLKELQSGDTVEGASTSYASTAEVSGTHTTGSITSGTSALTVASGSGIADGDAVVGEGITPGTTVSSGGGTTSITLSANANATLSSDPVSFYTTTKSLSPGNAAGMLCRAWVNFKGTGTVAIRASYNVSSITDNGGSGGDYTVNFTSAMPDVGYTVSGVIGDAALADAATYSIKLMAPDTAQLTSSVRIGTTFSNVTGGTGTITDFSSICVIIFR